MTDSAGEWTLEHGADLVFASCSMLRAVDGVCHAFSTRRCSVAGDGPDRFDLGGRTSTPVTESRRRRLLRAAGLEGRQPVPLHQVHGSRVVFPASRGPLEYEVPFEADGVILLDGSGGPWVAAVRTADCVAVLIADREGRTVGAVHAGWRGVAAGVLPKAVSELGRRGIPAGDLVVALGPAVGPCCYVVGPEVREAFEEALEGAGEAFRPAGGGLDSLDLHRALRVQLDRGGVPGAAVSAAPWCTACRGDLFFSYRRDRERAGRMMAVIGLGRAT